MAYRYRKQMKRGYSRTLYNQQNKNETIMSVIKRLFGECLISRLTRTQNRELSFRCIAYNMHRLTNLVIITMVSTEPVSLRISLYVLSKAIADDCAKAKPSNNGLKLLLLLLLSFIFCLLLPELLFEDKCHPLYSKCIYFIIHKSILLCLVC